MNRIKFLREQHGEKQADIAAWLEITQATLSNWERGVHDPDSESLLRLADRFNVTVDYLLGRTNDDDQTPHYKEWPDFSATDGERTIYLDAETYDMVDALRSRPDAPILFKLAMNTKKEDLEAIVEFVDKMRGTNNNDDGGA